ncbi:MAG TPA: HAMP domain-containing sensor histidine kinase [Acidimicrobiales bacterium]|nr:HAMP domain-containing sensor histidine kinase [Acidimicrobiales bacterium]
MSLRWRIAVGLAVIAGIVCTAASVGAYLSTKQQLLNSIDESLVARSHDANDDRGPNFGGRPGPGGQRNGCPQPGDLQPSSAAQIVAPDGTITQCILGGPLLPVASVGLQTISIDGTPYRMLTSPWHEGGLLQIGRDLDEVQDVLTDMRLRLFLLALGGTLAAAALGWWLARRIVRPVVKLRDTAEQIASTQDLSTPIPSDGDGEVGSLARSFTTMVDALATSRAQQQRLITDASHEMRTPLTSLRTNIELLGRADNLPEGQRVEVVDALQLEVSELSELVAELVELATDSSKAEPAEPVRLAELAGDVATRAVRRSGREVNVISDDGTETVVAQPAQLERAISNLVDNALKYSPDGTPVDISVTATDVVVRDRGPGIASEDLPRVFDRFYRSTLARSQPGSGLGLAIVQQIVERNGGRVWATNRPDGGAEVGFSLK